MIKTLKVRLYPDKEQIVLLERHFGACRFVWNHFLEIRTKYYAENRDKKDAKKGLTVFDTIRMLTLLKKEKEWLYEINSQSLQHSLVKLDIAFRSFFKPSIPDNVGQIVIAKDVNRYYASIQYETTEVLAKGEGCIGMDMGIKAFLTTSDGIQIEPLNTYREHENRLKRQ